jgi:hypothetical protein
VRGEGRRRRSRQTWRHLQSPSLSQGVLPNVYLRTLNGLRKIVAGSGIGREAEAVVAMTASMAPAGSPAQACRRCRLGPAVLGSSVTGVNLASDMYALGEYRQARTLDEEILVVVRLALHPCRP